jgi:DNA-directed RNA polymerase specialized sigma24 family protein
VELGGLSYAEIAALLDMSTAAVRSCLYRARLTLREALTPPSPIAQAVTGSDSHHED